MRPRSSLEATARRVRAATAALLLITATVGVWVMWPRPAPPEIRAIRRQQIVLPEQPRHGTRRVEVSPAPATSFVSPPVIDAVITLTSAVLGVDCRAERRSATALGLAGLTAETRAAFLQHGA